MNEQAEHGDERARRTETQRERKEFTRVSDGTKLVIEYNGVTQTVSERYCEVCGEWRTAKGIMGALFCPICSTPWNKKFWEEK